MKKILSLASVVVLAGSILMATAQEQPKKASEKEAKMDCCASKANVNKKDCDMSAKMEKCDKNAKKEACDKSKSDCCKMASKASNNKADNNKN